LITIEQQPGTTTCVARISGELDTTTVPELRAVVDRAVNHGCLTVVCDLENVSYMDSSALGFLVWADRRLQPVSGRLVLAGANPDVTRIIELSGLIGIVPSVSAAVSVGDALSTITPQFEDSEPQWTESFSFPAELSMMASVRSRIAELVKPLGLSESAQFDLKVAVGEALANAIRHGSPRGTTDEVAVVVTAYPDRIVVGVSDSGCGFDGTANAGTDIYAPSGRGVLFMRALADSVEFALGANGGTCVQLVKRRDAETADAPS
jgi:anti-anti-sigma factor